MEIGTVRLVDIDDEMQQAYLSYAMSVIVARALPDVRDGLKPVQRRILYACHDMGLHPTSPYKKSARIVGEVLGKYHPHGDAAVYDAMARMAQDFSLRYTLIDGQGNFGSVDGDAPAAMRYTEARLAHMAVEMLADIQKDTVDYGPNFDDSLQEPLVLPAAIPALLINGAAGIAVGMATNIPPHNLGEVIDALAYTIDRWNKLDDVSVEDLMKFVKGPDFPTGGIVYRYDERVEGGDAVRTAYATGRGHLTVQAKAHIEEIGRGKANIIVTELPYQVNKSNLIERIATLVRDGKVEGITDVRDESDRSGMRLIIETTRTVEPKEILAQLYKHTPLRSTFGIILLALVDGEPRTLSLKKILQLYVEHRQEIVTRRTRYDLARAQERAHILEGLLKALASIDEVIQLIRRSPDADTARQRLMKRFKLSEIQANAILDMPLRRLARLERDKLEAEYKELKGRIKYWQDLLKHPAKILALIKEELLALKAKYADGRRTHIAEHEKGELMTTRELTPEASVWIGLGTDGQLARLGEKLRVPGEGTVAALVQANTRDTLYVFNDRGRAGQTPLHQLPASGANVADLTGLARDDRFVAALALPRDEELTGFVLFGTRGAVVKRVALPDFVRATGSAFGAINVDEGDSLEWVRLSQGDGEIVLATQGGQAIRFTEDSVRPMGLNASGVLGIKLGTRDAVIGMDLARARADLLIVTENGYGKRTPLSEYPVQGRYGNGVITARPSSSSGMLVGAAVVNASTQLAVATDKGQSKLFKASLAPSRKRDARMDGYVSLRRGDSVAALVVPLEQAEAGEMGATAGPDSPGQAATDGQPTTKPAAATRTTSRAKPAGAAAKAGTQTRRTAARKPAATTRKTSKPAAAARKSAATAKPATTRKTSKPAAAARKSAAATKKPAAAAKKPAATAKKPAAARRTSKASQSTKTGKAASTRRKTPKRPSTSSG